jgi:translation initiation factor 2B subunit (eIF-2B alpha/beta/delta family)
VRNVKNRAKEIHKKGKTMSEPNQEQQEAQSEAQANLNEELRQLGSQLERAVRSVFSSDPARNFQRDISSSLNEINDQFQNALKSINENPDIQKLSTQGQQVVGQIQEVAIVQEFQKVLANGVSLLNQQIDSFLTNVQGSEKEPNPATTPQKIKIEEE